jgi:hypothetical protein
MVAAGPVSGHDPQLQQAIKLLQMSIWNCRLCRASLSAILLERDERTDAKPEPASAGGTIGPERQHPAKKDPHLDTDLKVFTPMRLRRCGAAEPGPVDSGCLLRPTGGISLDSDEYDFSPLARRKLRPNIWISQLKFRGGGSSGKTSSAW